MKERQLRDLFVSSLKSGHIEGNIFEGRKNQRFENKDIFVKDQYYFRSFDLVVVRVLKDDALEPSRLTMVDYDDLENLLVRNRLLGHYAREKRSRIDQIRFYPIELKSDDDVLDSRLPNQILNAILTFGNSIIVLDHDHSKRIVRNHMLNLFPSTIVAYTGKDDHFKMLYFYNRFVANTFFDMPRRQVAKILYENGLGNKVSKMYKVLSIIQKINQKVIFNQMFNVELSLSPNELEFIEKLSDYQITSERRQLSDLIRASMNYKITEYL